MLFFIDYVSIMGVYIFVIYYYSEICPKLGKAAPIKEYSIIAEKAKIDRTNSKTSPFLVPCDDSSVYTHSSSGSSGFLLEGLAVRGRDVKKRRIMYPSGCMK
jgi:hypothetical protein